MLSNREIATAIWLAILLAHAFTKTDVRQASARVVELFVHPKILVPVMVLLAYTAGVTWILFRVGLWVPSLLKDTVLWFTLTGFGVFMSAVTSNSPDRVIASSIRDSLKVVVVLEFLVNAHTYSLLAELIFVPAVTLILMLDVVALADEKYSAVAKVLNWAQILVGLGIIVDTAWWAIANYTTLRSLDALRTIALGPILSAVFIPVIHLFVLYANYERVFVRLHMGRTKSRSLTCYAKQRILRYASIRISRVLDLTRRAADIMRLDSRESVDEFISSLEAGNPSVGRLEPTDAGVDDSVETDKSYH